MCNAIVQSGSRKGQKCRNRPYDNGFCGCHQRQHIQKMNEIYIINNSGKNIALEQKFRFDDAGEGDNTGVMFYTLIKLIYPDTVYKLIKSENSDITDYCVTYMDGEFYENRGYHIKEDFLLQIGEVKQLIISQPVPYNYGGAEESEESEEVKVLSERLDKWKSVALKALTIPKEIKKLNSSDTVDALCDLTEYIELPEEVSARDYELAGARYNPDDEAIPLEDPDLDLDDTLELEDTLELYDESLELDRNTLVMGDSGDDTMGYIELDIEGYLASNIPAVTRSASQR